MSLSELLVMVTLYIHAEQNNIPGSIPVSQKQESGVYSGQRATNTGQVKFPVKLNFICIVWLLHDWLNKSFMNKERHVCSYSNGQWVQIRTL